MATHGLTTLNNERGPLTDMAPEVRNQNTVQVQFEAYWEQITNS